MDNREELMQHLSDMSRRKPVKKFESDKGYNRARDRKDKRLYEVEPEEDDGAQ